MVSLSIKFKLIVFFLFPISSCIKNQHKQQCCGMLDVLVNSVCFHHIQGIPYVSTSRKDLLSSFWKVLFLSISSFKSAEDPKISDAYTDGQSNTKSTLPLPKTCFFTKGLSVHDRLGPRRIGQEASGPSGGLGQPLHKSRLCDLCLFSKKSDLKF